MLRKYTKGKKITELKAEVEKARSDMLAKQETYNLEKSKEQKLRDQISKTILRAPNDGLVVYANETNRFGGNNQPQIEEGAQVRERQKIFSLPDISRMRVNTKVHESMIDRITPGLSARLRVDAFAGQVLNGKVESVQPLPDPSSFFASDIKVYTTQVAIDKGHGGLRPGMTAQVEILVTQLDDVISTPVQSILEFKGKDHVYVITPEGPVRREVKLGISNDKFVEIKEGLKAGEEVAMNPGSLLTEAEKREAFATSAKGATKKEWSKEAIAAGKTAGAPGAPGAGGDPAKKKDASKKKGGRGGMANNPIMQKIRGLTTKNLTPEEQAKLRDFSLPQSEREALYKKAGVTPEDLEQMKEAFKKMMEAGGGGFGGGPPGGGFGGGPGGGGGFGGGGGQPQ